MQKLVLLGGMNRYTKDRGLEREGAWLGEYAWSPEAGQGLLSGGQLPPSNLCFLRKESWRFSSACLQVWLGPRNLTPYAYYLIGISLLYFFTEVLP